MNETTLEAVFESLLRRIVREEFQALTTNRSNKPVAALGKPYLTVREAAETSGLGASTIRLAIRRRQLRAQRVRTASAD
ncbi:MAG: hypothetical protein ACREQ2_04895 [Candidatus Binatia bacterium]